MKEHTEARSIQAEDEISSVDIIRFFSRNVKFIGLVTLGLSALAIAFSLVQPKQYQKQLTLSVQPTAVPVSSFSTMDVNQANALAIKFLQNPQLNPIIAQPIYNLETQKIDLNLQSPDQNALSAVDPKVVGLLQTSFQAPLGEALKTSLIATEIQLKKHQQILALLNQQIAQIPPTSTAKLEALETQRSHYVAAIASLQFDKDYLEQSRKNLADFTANFMSVQILSGAKVQPISSLKQIVVIAIIASLMVAVLAALIREQVARLKQELAKPKQIDTTAQV